jgi:uncharacterized protein YgiM (DUF1202 family)
MKIYISKIICIVILVFAAAISEGQNSYFNNQKDSLKIDSILKAEYKSPKNILIARYDTASNPIYKSPSKNSEVAGYIEFVLAPATIIIEKSKQETIAGKTGNWYRVFALEISGFITGWVFSADALLLKPDINNNLAEFTGTYHEYMASPCNNFLTVKTTDDLSVSAYYFYAFFNNSIDMSECFDRMTELKNVKIDGNIFSGDSTGFSKAWFMRSEGTPEKASKEYLLIKYADFFGLYYKVAENISGLENNYLTIQGDNVNLRSGPSTKDNIIIQLQNQTPCWIIEVGPKQTINNKTDNWYKVWSNYKTGWVFGAFTKFTP